MKRLLYLILVCLTTAQVNNEVCRLICRNDSYDTGIYLSAQKACLCGTIKSYTELEEKRLALPIKLKSNRNKKYFDDEY